MVGKKENALVYMVGSVGYTALELMWRGYTSWTMTATGGVCFGLLYRLHPKIEHLRLWKQCIVGGGVITVVEFAAGMLFNRLLKMKVWDYSDRPFHFKGQVCLLYSLLWCLLCLPVMQLCGWVNKRFES